MSRLSTSTAGAVLLLALTLACTPEGPAPLRSASEETVSEASAPDNGAPGDTTPDLVREDGNLGKSPDPKATRTGTEVLREAASRRRLNAAFLIVDGVYNTELTAPFDVLDHTIYHAPAGLGIDVFTVSPDGEPVTTAEGLTILPDFRFDNTPPVDILVVPSAEGSRDSDLANEALVEWVSATGQEAPVVLSLCWGAFVLAEAGLLDNRECTTFPSDYATLAGRFPELRLRVNVSFVHDRNAITSQGGARSFDAAMYLVDVLYGQQVAQNIGAGLLIEWPLPARVGVSFHVTPPSAH